MPTTRPIWRGQLRLSLVSIGVELFPATKAAAKPAFHQIHEPTGKRIRYEKVVEGVGPVAKDEIKKGYEYEKGDYVLIEDDELDAVKLETKKTLELVQFVDETEIPPLYFDTPYFMVPADDLSEEAFQVVRDALRKTNKIGIGQLALRGNEYLVALKPYAKGLLLETMHYDNEIKKPDTFFSGVPARTADNELLEVATALIEKKTQKWDPKAYKNHYQSALRELIQRKMKAKGRKITVEEEEARPERGNVIDLMSALKKSLDSGGRKPGAVSKRRAAAKTARKSAPRRKAG